MAKMSELAELVVLLQQQAETQKQQMLQLMEKQERQHREEMQLLTSQLGAGGVAGAGPSLFAQVGSPTFVSFEPSTELWKDYLARFKTFVGANSIPNAKQSQVFLTNQSATIYKLLCTLASQFNPPKDVNELSLDEIIKMMEEQFDPKRFVVRERYKFWSDMNRKPGETVQELAARIRQQAATCDFTAIKDPQDESMRTKFICSVKNEAVIKALFKVKDDELTFSRAVEIAAETEEAAKAAKETTYGIGAVPVNKVVKSKFQKKQSSKKGGASKSDTKACHRCGRAGHKPQDCSFRDAECYNCKKKGHLSAVCRSKTTQTNPKVGSITVKLPQTVSTTLGSEEDKLQVSLQVNHQPVKFDVDTGSRDSFCSKDIWEKVGKPTLEPPLCEYLTCTRNKIPVLGTFSTEVWMENSPTKATINFNVWEDFGNLLGLKAMRTLKLDINDLVNTPLLSSINAVMEDMSPDLILENSCKKVCAEFPDLFKEELGCLKDFELDVKFKSDAKPVFCKPRTVPYAMLEDLNMAYEAGIKKGVWEPTTFCEYGTPVVPIKKVLLPGQNKAKIRVCGDYSVTVNPQLETHRQPMPLPDELIHRLSGGYYFSKIDLADAYNQVKLSPESQKKLALSTHRGVLLQKRLPFGISSAPGYFQEIMEKITRDLTGVAVYLDDILVSGCNAVDHLENLRALLQRLQDKGLRCKLEKCAFAQPSVEYLGHTLSRKGVSKGHKVEAVIKMPAPKNVNELRSFLGSVQFYGKWIPNLSTRAAPLFDLTKKDQPWSWTGREQRAFQDLKEVLSSDTILAHFDPGTPIGIACDASSVGIGAVLFHRYSDGSERPIANASKTLTETQRKYSQVHKEALSVIFGLKKFHQFLFGRKFILVTDHKPLLTLFSPSKGTPAIAANRLARWALTLSQYDYTIEYRKTSDHGNADALSRLPQGEDISFDREEEKEEVSTVLTIKQVSLQLNPTAPGLIVKESKLDPIIAQVMRYVQEGWPQRIDSEEIKIFKKMSDSLCVENGCLFLGARIVIPAKLRMGVLDLIHVGHFGMQKMKQLARSVVYWPNINADIEKVAKSCTSCAEHQNNPSKPANHPWMLPEKPWSRVHVDHAINFMGENWLVVVDAYSKYPIIHPTTAVSTRATIRLLEEDFAHFGNPHSIVSDNATTFKSEEFQQWCKERGITHLTGAPYHPATNGAAERLVQSFKQSVKKSKRPPKEALQDFLMQYRRTPLDQGLSPSELLNGRQIRTTLDAIVPSPAHTAQGKQAAKASKEQAEESLQTVQKLAYKYVVGSPCYAKYYSPRQHKQPRWVPATVVKVLGTRSVNVRVLPKGPTWRRHIDQLRPRWSSLEDNSVGDDFNTSQSQMEGDLNNAKGTNKEIATSQMQDTQESENVGTNSYGPENPRRSKRAQKKPDFFGERLSS